MEDPSIQEGAKLQLSGVFPPGGAEHLKSLIQNAAEHVQRPKLKVVNPDTLPDDPLIESALASVDETLSELEKEYAQRAAEIQKIRSESAPNVTNNAANEELRSSSQDELARKLQQVVRDAAADGVRFGLKILRDSSQDQV